MRNSKAEVNGRRQQLLVGPSRDKPFHLKCSAVFFFFQLFTLPVVLITAESP